MKLRTLRGQVNAGEIKQLIQADGNLNVGFKVLEFFVWPQQSTISSQWHAVLGLDGDTPATLMLGGDNRQIGWAGNGNEFYLFDGKGVLDPDHLVMEDLYLTNTSTPNIPLNYLIMIQPMRVSDDTAVMSLIKSRSQDVERP